ncbi:MAG: M67 family metallopeptidase [Acidobacteriota bacterium]
MLKVARSVMEEISSQVVRGYPDECCGLLIGQAKGKVREARVAFPATNLNRDRARDRYELDPVDFRRADETARRTGADIIGIYHSHPDHPSRPSGFDQERAWEGYSYLILRVTGKGVDGYRSWELDDGSFREEPLEILESAPGEPRSAGGAPGSGQSRR